MSREHVGLVEAAYAAVDRDDIDALLALVHPEAEFRSLIAESEGLVYHGHEGVREWWDTVAHSLGGLRFERERIEGARDAGVTRLLIVATHEGVEVPQRMWNAWRVRDGLIVWWAVFRTEAEALEAVGLRE